MASITEVGKSKRFKVTIRVKGYPTECKTFKTLGEAQRWATKVESQIPGFKPNKRVGDNYKIRRRKINNRMDVNRDD